MPVSFFFDDIAPEVAAQVDQRLHEESGSAVTGDDETNALLECYFKISSPTLRKRLRELIKSLGDSIQGDVDPEDFRPHDEDDLAED